MLCLEHPLPRTDHGGLYAPVLFITIVHDREVVGDGRALEGGSEQEREILCVVCVVCGCMWSVFGVCGACGVCVCVRDVCGVCGVVFVTG